VLPSLLCVSPPPHPEVLEPAQPGRASKDGPAPSASVLRGSASGRAPQDEDVELALPFGAASSVMLIAAADLAERFGNGAIRVTTTRRLVLTGLHGDPAILGGAIAAGFITDPDDPRLHIAACAGRPACPSGWADVRADAAALSTTWRGHETLHVSGCAKGCAHPGPAVMTLVATPEGYDLVRNGRAGGAPERTGLSLAQVRTLLAADHAAERPTVSL
jgi:precorrin-3B synthase